MKTPAILAACSALTLTVPAHAAIVTKTLAFTGSNFTLLFGDNSVAPIDPATILSTVTLDTALDYTATTAGFTFSSNLPYSAQFAYSSSLDLLTIATFPFPGGCSNNTSSFCSFVVNFSGIALPTYLQQTTSTRGFYTADIVARVPEPASWALLILGIGGVGAALRRRQMVKLAYD